VSGQCLTHTLLDTKIFCALRYAYRVPQSGMPAANLTNSFTDRMLRRRDDPARFAGRLGHEGAVQTLESEVRGSAPVYRLGIALNGVLMLPMNSLLSLHIVQLQTLPCIHEVREMSSSLSNKSVI
jgi:hypothetical protein